MLVDKIREDLKEAMKAKDSRRVETLRFLLSEVKNVGINEKRELDDPVVLGVIQKLSKQRREGIEQFRAAGRADLVAKEEAELGLLGSYLPKQLSDAELEERLRGLAAEVGATCRKDMGKVMKVATVRLAGLADGKRMQSFVQKILP